MTDLAGFDVCLAIGRNGLAQALQSRIQPLARDALRGITLPLPNAPSTTLDVNVTVPASASIDGAQRRVTLQPTGTGDLRMGVNGQSLVSLPVGAPIPAGLASVPISVSVPIAATLVLTIVRAGGGLTQVVIDQVQVTTATPGFPPANLATTLATQLTTQLTALLANTGGTVQAAQVTSTANALAAAIPGAVTSVVTTRFQGLFPLPIDFTLPAVNQSLFCNIGLRDVQVALLGADAGAGTDACLAIATTLLSDSTGNVANLRSPLPANQAAGIFFDNFFLMSAICCGVRSSPQLNLPAPSPLQRGASPLCCRWSGLNVDSTLDGRLFHVHDASVCLDATDAANKRIVMQLGMTTSDVGWDATVSVTVPLHLSIQNGAVVPIIEQPVVTVHVDLAWWVIVIEVVLVAVLALITAGIGALVGGIVAAIAAAITAGTAIAVGAGIGAVIGIVVGIVIAVAVNRAIENSVSQTLQAASGALAGPLSALNVVPAELQQVFGRLEAATLHFDDLRVLGRMVVPPPPDERVLIEIRDVVLNAGTGIDLDRGTVVSASDPGADLTWRVPRLLAPVKALAREALLPGDGDPIPTPTPTLPPALASKRPAGLVAISNLTYASVHLANVRLLPFGTGGGLVLATAVPTGTVEPLRPLVLGARTGEGRFAKCSVWQEPTGRLHLRYALWNTPASLGLTQRWTSQRGSLVPSFDALRTTWEVARTGTFHAPTSGLVAPIAYTWLWDGSVLQNGAGPLAGGIQRVEVSGDTCVIHTDFGEDLDGELCVSATDAFGVRSTVCRPLSVSGTDSELDLPTIATRELDVHDVLDLWLAIHGGDPAPDAMLEVGRAARLAGVAEAVQLEPIATQIQTKLQELGAAGRG